MKALVEPLEGNKVKLTVEVDEAEFDKALNAAFKRLAQEVRIPGFRPGKAPRRILEAKLGTGVAREEAVRESLPGYYADALRETEVDAIAPPEIDITSGREDGPLAFDAVVEVRPKITVPGYKGIKVTVPAPEATDDDLAAQIDRLRAQGAQLDDVARAARAGDAVVLDIHGTAGGEPVEGAEATDLTYDVGSGSLVDGLDEQVAGAKVGDVLTFSAELPGHEAPVDFRVLVKGVKEKILPEVDDEWAGEVSEFDTVAELRADLANRLSTVKRVNARLALREGVGESLAAMVVDEVPTALVDAEIQRRVEDLAHRLEHQGASLTQWLEAIGQTAEEFLEGLRGEAATTVRVDLALRSVAEAESIEATDDDIDDEIAKVATSSGEKPERLRRQLERNGAIPAVRQDLRRAKALEWLIENAEVVDPNGKAVDRALLEEPEPQPEPEEQVASVSASASGEDE